jgi:hypothetical protein
MRPALKMGAVREGWKLQALERPVSNRSPRSSLCRPRAPVREMAGK